LLGFLAATISIIVTQGYAICKNLRHRGHPHSLKGNIILNVKYALQKDKYACKNVKNKLHLYQHNKHTL
jgi:hypothetical protein